jgi:hypothetical protein
MDAVACTVAAAVGRAGSYLCSVLSTSTAATLVLCRRCYSAVPEAQTLRGRGARARRRARARSARSAGAGAERTERGRGRGAHGARARARTSVSRCYRQTGLDRIGSSDEEATVVTVTLKATLPSFPPKQAAAGDAVAIGGAAAATA